MQIISKTENELVIKSQGIKSGIITGLVFLILSFFFFGGSLMFHTVKQSSQLLIIGFGSAIAGIGVLFQARDILLTVTKENIIISKITPVSKTKNCYNLQSLQRIEIRNTVKSTLCFLFLLYTDGRLISLGFFPNDPLKIGIALSEFLRVPFYNPFISYMENDPTTEKQ